MYLVILVVLQYENFLFWIDINYFFFNRVDIFSSFKFSSDDLNY